MNIRLFYTTVLTLVLTILTTFSTININTQAAQNSGTYSTGGIFSPEARAFLDAIARHEAEGDTLALSSYNSGNYTQNDFDALTSYDTRPKLRSGGYTNSGEKAWDIGRYQYLSGEYSMGDINTANEGLKKAGINYTIANFQPTSQDHYPIGKYAMRAQWLGRPNTNLPQLLAKGEAGLMEALGVGSGEWASFPYVDGYTHVAYYKPLWSVSEFKTYYYQRLDYYKTNSTPTTTATKVVNKEVPQSVPAKVIEAPVAKATPSPIQYLNTAVSDNKYITFQSNTDNSKCIDLNQGSVYDYNKVQLANCNGSGAQKWILAKNVYANSYQIQSSVNNQFCLDINSYQDNLPAVLIYCRNANSQWIMSDEGQLKPTINTSYCLTTGRASRSKQTQSLTLQYCNGSSQQSWTY